MMKATIDEIISEYKRLGMEDTIGHLQRTVEIAERIAEPLGISDDRIEAAIWPHDIAFNLEADEMLKKAEEYGFDILEIERNVPVLLHGPVAAGITKEKWGVEDEDILNAIRYHTTLRAGASVLEKVCFLADQLEPGNRSKDPEEMIEKARKDLDAAVKEHLEYAIDWVKEQGWDVHPRMEAALEGIKN